MLAQLHTPHISRNVHGRNAGLRTGLSGQPGEGRGLAGLLNVTLLEASGKMGLGRQGLGDGDHIGAVDELAPVLPENRHLGHGGPERGCHLALVGWMKKERQRV